MPDFPIKITGDASELTKAATEAKEQLDPGRQICRDTG